jgi:hypothetical protein
MKCSGTSAQNGLVYAGIPQLLFFPEFHTGTCEYILLHIRFPGEHDLCILLHFHGNVTVLLRNSEFVTFPW